MVSALKFVKCPPNSASLAEARYRAFDLFKMACRSIPTIIQIYHLDDIVTPSQLRSTIASEFRKNSHVINPKVIDHLLFKGTEELSNIVQRAKQRHHVVGQYILGRDGVAHDASNNVPQISDFLKNFYESNYF